MKESIYLGSLTVSESEFMIIMVGNETASMDFWNLKATTHDTSSTTP